MGGSVIAGASMRCKTMADGSLRIEVEVEPRDAVAAFTLFGAVGTPVALAALKVGESGAEPGGEGDKPAEPKGGMLARLAGQWCQMPEFHEWCERSFRFSWNAIIEEIGEHAEHAEVAAELIRRHCGVKSRAELDHDKRAADQFHAAIRQPFAAHLQRQA